MDQRTPGVLVVVEDDPALRRALKFAFEVDGFDVRAFPDGESLLAERDLPDQGCLVVDYKLPGMNGLDLLSRLRRRGVALPAVLITTLTPAVLAQAAAAHVPVVGKPLLTGALLDMVTGLQTPSV
jgi:FixJ family two-component response regulator